ncbi:hypothetical protein [Abyssisolibacter fermentans]|uniref:hypothetical protein n=1 Tax=Abyssisolibacter fermentans TaxID=1766203 RepID=UPI00082BEB27|nr:hypothetical protein [Abyssisolibacter fermentans]
MQLKDVQAVMLFPYSEDMLNVFKFRESLEFKINSVVSFKSWGYIGKDAGTIDGGSISGYIVKSDFDRELDKIDTVILGSFRKYYGDTDIVDRYLDKILKAKKNVILLENHQNVDLEQYIKKFEEMGLKFYYFAPEVRNALLLNQISIPVIGVFGMEEDCGKTEMQLLIARALKKKGYKVSVIGSNTQIELLGGNIYPKALYGDDISEIKKIKTIRTFVNDIVEREKPHLLIISSPYGVNSFGDDEIDYKYNGILSHIIIEALHPDANIFCANGGRDLRWNKRSIETLELLSCAPTISVFTKRLNKIPEIASTKLNIELKKGIFNDEIFAELKRNCEELFDMKLADQDYVSDDEIVDLIENTFRVKNKLLNII